MQFIILQLFQQLLASFKNFQFFETMEPGQGGGGGGGEGEQTVGQQVPGTNMNLSRTLLGLTSQARIFWGVRTPQKFLAPLQRCLAPPQKVSAPPNCIEIHYYIYYLNATVSILMKKHPPKYFSTPPNQNMKIRPCNKPCLCIFLAGRYGHVQQ